MAGFDSGGDRRDGYVKIFKLIDHKNVFYVKNMKIICICIQVQHLCFIYLTYKSQKGIFGSFFMTP